MPTSRNTTRSSRTANDRRADLSPEVAWYLKNRGYGKPRRPPAIRTPEPRDAPGAKFDSSRVDQVINAMRLLPHTQGKWAGHPFEPSAWQVAYVIAPVFGWVSPNEDGELTRIVRSLYVELPRKAGKTSLGARLVVALTFADGERGAQGLTVAASKDQARFAFDPIRQITQQSKALQAAGIKALRDRVVQQQSGSYLAVVSSVGDLLHGANVHAALVDELHAHKTPAVLEAVETGTGARSQPLVVVITTADDGKQATVYDQRRRLIEQVAHRTVSNPGIYGVIWCAEETDDPFAEKTWRKANPGYEVTVSRAFMRHEAQVAKQSPAQLASFQRLHLGIRTKQDSRYITMPVWDRNASMVDESKLAGRECYGGLDLASTNDLCALAWDFPDDDGGHDVVWRFWTPEANVRRLNERTAGQANVWVREGWLHTTPGEVADYDYIRAQINTDRDTFDVRQVGYDPWNATQLVNDLMADGAPMVKVRQGFVSLSAPTKALAHLLSEGTAEKPRYRHSGNPVMRWMVDHLGVETDAAGNVKPSKRRSAEKVDGVTAAVMALDRAINRPEKRVSAYEAGGLEIV